MTATPLDTFCDWFSTLPRGTNVHDVLAMAVAHCHPSLGSRHHDEALNDLPALLRPLNPPEVSTRLGFVVGLIALVDLTIDTSKNYDPENIRGFHRRTLETLEKEEFESAHLKEVVGRGMAQADELSAEWRAVRDSWREVRAGELSQEVIENWYSIRLLTEARESLPPVPGRPLRASK